MTSPSRIVCTSAPSPVGSLCFTVYMFYSEVAEIWAPVDLFIRIRVQPRPCAAKRFLLFATSDVKKEERKERELSSNCNIP
jgi:hypothetical protein